MLTPPVTTYFTGLAEVYNQYRPTYPIEAVKWIVHGCKRPITVADVGCGTGISTRLLARVADRVIGIDPNDDMLAQARRESTDAIEYRTGTGENTTLADGAVNVVVCAQSFHWFNASRALAEFHRITRPGGRLALMWNIRDDRDAFTAGYGDVVRRAQADALQRGLDVRNDHSGDITAGGHFTLIERRRFANPQVFDLDGLLGRARSASYFPRSGSLRTELEKVLKALFEQHQRSGQVTMQQFTEVTLATRTDNM
jgi:SAM-dependent methyltransferase